MKKILLNIAILLSLTLTITSYASDNRDEIKDSQPVNKIINASKELPNELLQEIFSFLDVKTLKTCRTTSRLFAKLVILNNQNRSTDELVVKLKHIDDFDNYLSHNRQYSIPAVNIAFHIDRGMFFNKDLSHLVYLSSSWIRDEGVLELCNANLDNLKTLLLFNNGMGFKTAAELARTKWIKNLRSFCS